MNAEYSVPVNKVCAYMSEVAGVGLFRNFFRRRSLSLSTVVWRKPTPLDGQQVPKKLSSAIDAIVAIGVLPAAPSIMVIVGERQWFDWPDAGRFVRVWLKKIGGPHEERKIAAYDEFVPSSSLSTLGWVDFSRASGAPFGYPVLGFGGRLERSAGQ